MEQFCMKIFPLDLQKITVARMLSAGKRRRLTELKV